MKKLSRQKVFVITMFLWIVDVICTAVLAEYAGLITHFCLERYGPVFLDI